MADPKRLKKTTMHLSPGMQEVLHPGRKPEPSVVTDSVIYPPPKAMSQGAANRRLEELLEAAGDVLDGNTQVSTENVTVDGAPAGKGLDLLSTEAIDMPATPEGYEVVWLSVGALKPNPYNPRGLAPTEAQTKDLALAIVQNKGIRHPLQVMVNPEDPQGYIIIDGHRRWQASRFLGMLKVPAVIRGDIAVGSQEAYRLGYALTNSSEKISDIGNALAWKTLMNDGIFRYQSEIAEVTGLSQPHVSRTLSFLKFPEPLLSRMAEHPFQFTGKMAAELVTFMDTYGETETQSLIEQLVLEGGGLARVQAALHRKQRATQYTEGSRQPIHWGHKIVGHVRWSNSGVLVDIPQASQEMAEELRKMLAEFFEKKDHA